MMPLQRACDAENQARNNSPNGPRRAQSNVIFTEYSATSGIRQLPGICWYPIKAHGFSREYKVAPRIVSYKQYVIRP